MVICVDCLDIITVTPEEARFLKLIEIIGKLKKHVVVGLVKLPSDWISIIPLDLRVEIRRTK